MLVRVGIVGSWWLMDDAIHALFASEAKRFLRACGGFVNLRIWARAQGPPIGAGSAGQGRSGGVLGRTFCKFAEGGPHTGPDDPGGRNPENLPKVSRMRRQKGNLANWHGFSGGQQAARRRRRAREMQICTSEIAAVNPPMGGICRGGHRSANLRNGVQAHCRQGGRAKLRILVQMASG